MYKQVSLLVLIGLSGLGAIASSTMAASTASETPANIPASSKASLNPLQSTAPVSSMAQNRTQRDVPKGSPNVPDKLRVAPGSTLLLKTPAKGVQIYVCQPKAGNASQFEWTLKAPEADLLNEKSALIGKHYGGPTWEHKDGSKVVGEVKERSDSPVANAIPWLLLTAKANEGNGIFGKVMYIQRVNTSGGKAPASGCDRSKQNAQTRVGYTADYYYYGAAPNKR